MKNVYIIISRIRKEEASCGRHSVQGTQFIKTTKEQKPPLAGCSKMISYFLIFSLTEMLLCSLLGGLRRSWHVLCVLKTLH